MLSWPGFTKRSTGMAHGQYRLCLHYLLC